MNNLEMVVFFGGLLVIWSLVYGVMSLVNYFKNKKENETLGRIWERYKKD